jgi:HAD domain in Swiss Army Knife RNA repair proteins
MDVLFLDIDGCLNSAKYIKRIDIDFDDPKYQIDPDAVVRLNAITQLTGAKIVVSSTWRYAFKGDLSKLQDCMASYNITGRVIGMTPEPELLTNSILYIAATRSDEIQAWLNNHNDIDHYVIIDDETLDETLSAHHVQPLFESGLQDHHVRQTLTILGYQ